MSNLPDVAPPIGATEVTEWLGDERCFWGQTYLDAAHVIGVQKRDGTVMPEIGITGMDRLLSIDDASRLLIALALAIDEAELHD